MNHAESSEAQHVNTNASLLTEQLQSIVTEAEHNRPKLDVEFLQVQHTPEYYQDIVLALADKDIILMEMIHGTDAQRAEEEQVINIALQGIRQSEEQQAVDQILRMKSEDGSPELLALIAKKFKDSGKQFKFVEPLPSDLERQALETARRKADREFVRGIKTYAEVDRLREAIRGYILAAADEYSYREFIVAQQVQAVIDDEQDSPRTLKLAVMQGAVHTPTYHAFARQERLSAKRRYIGPPPIQKGRSQKRTYEEELIGSARMHKEADLSESKIDRAILAYELERFVYPEKVNQKRQDLAARSQDLIRILIESLTNEQVLSALQQVHQLGINPGDQQIEDIKTYLLNVVEVARSQNGNL